MRQPAKVLLQSIIDYAGVFPPAALDLGAAMAAYAKAWAGPHAGLLGRFVLPASALDDFARLAMTCSGNPQSWPLAVIMSGDPAELTRVARFNERWAGGKAIRALEFGMAGGGIEAVAGDLPDHVEAFFELPLDAGLGAAIATVARRRAFAKVRTGGVTANAIPAAADLARFIDLCAAAGAPFKATAGLHHALRGRYALTYDADSIRADMHGFLNVSVAAVLAHARAPIADVTDALCATSASSFTVTDAGLEWRGEVFDAVALEASRRLFRSFGSCAFAEPIQELERLGLT